MSGFVRTNGTWRQVAVVVDGKSVPVGAGALLTVADDGYTVTVNGNVYQRGTSKTDSEKTPRQSDVHVTEGPGAGQTLAQIFTIEGDVLIACSAPPEKVRPVEFTSPPGSGHTLSVWLRETGATASPRLTWLTWRFGVVVGLSVVLANLLGSEGESLRANLGYWPGVLVLGAVGALFVTAICLLLKWGWWPALITGITMSLAVNLFEGLRVAVAPAVGAPGAIAVSASTAFVAAILLGMVLTRLLKARW